VGRPGPKTDSLRHTQAARHASTASRRLTPELWASRDAPCLERAQGRPGAGWHPRSAVRRLREDRCTAAYRAARTPRPFPAQWFDGLWRALPGERCTIAPVVLRLIGARARSGRFTTASLDAQTPGVRTTRFCRTLEPHRSCARRSTAHGPSPPCNCRRADAPMRRCAPRPPPPGPRIVTIAKRPLSMGRDGANLRYFRISVKKNSKNEQSPRSRFPCGHPSRRPLWAGSSG